MEPGTCDILTTDTARAPAALTLVSDDIVGGGWYRLRVLRDSDGTEVIDIFRAHFGGQWVHLARSVHLPERE